MEKLGGEFQSKSSNAEHWMDFDGENLINSEDGSFYLTMTLNLEDNAVSLYSLGSCIGKNICNENYLDSTLICDSSIPFTVGVLVSGSPVNIQYSNFLLYGCRLYDRVLSATEIKQNYDASKNLLDS